MNTLQRLNELEARFDGPIPAYLLSPPWVQELLTAMGNFRFYTCEVRQQCSAIRARRRLGLPVDDYMLRREARRLIAEKGWCRGAYARNRGRRAVSERSEDAAAFCSIGALHRAAGDNPIDRALFCLHRTVARHHNDCVASWNDARTRTREQVLAAFDRAIALASAGDLP